MALKKPLVFDSGVPAELNSADTLDVDAAAVFNESGADVDFRIESDSQPQMFTVDAGSNTVGIGNSVAGAIASFSNGLVSFNNDNANRGFQVLGSTGTLLGVDVSSNSAQIGPNTVGNFGASLIVFNDPGGNVDFRVEGDSLTHMLFCDGSDTSENIALVAAAVPSWQNMDRGLFIGNTSAAPTGNPTSGVFLWAESGELKVRDGAGQIAFVSNPFGLNPGGRLSLESGVPVSTTDQAGQTLYYTPYLYGFIPLWNGTAWQVTPFSETSISFSAASNDTNYDVFGYLSSGTLALESVAWTNATTRATAITYQNGALCKSGDATRLYLGTVRRATTNVLDQDANRYLFNMFNRVPRRGFDVPADSTYTGNTVREIGGGGSRLNFLLGTPEILVEFYLMVSASMAGGGAGLIGAAVDSTTTMAGIRFSVTQSFTIMQHAHYFFYPDVGQHFLAALEQSDGTNTLTVSALVSLTVRSIMGITISM